MFKSWTMGKTIWAAAVAGLLAATFQVVNTGTQGIMWEGPNVKNNEMMAKAQIVTAEAEKIKAAALIATAEADKVKAQAEIEKAKAEQLKGRAELQKSDADQKVADAYEKQVAIETYGTEQTNKYIIQPMEELVAINSRIAELQEKVDNASSAADKAWWQGHVDFHEKKKRRMMSTASRTTGDVVGLFMGGLLGGQK
ncbi:hypothetical protein F183_A21050 [Bryobacterales bacterium F-183]|nr:hypothetical protein F183_A21050 [Bryobacterales bacterium F-183]